MIGWCHNCWTWQLRSQARRVRPFEGEVAVDRHLRTYETDGCVICDETWEFGIFPRGDGPDEDPELAQEAAERNLAGYTLEEAFDGVQARRAPQAT